MRYFIYLFYLLILISPVYSISYISQINFLDDEFVEVYSNNSINIDLSNSTITDENLGFNTLSKIKNSPNSNFSLIVGTNFISKNNISNLNCNIYSTGLTSPGKFGLKNTGENLIINISNSIQINFTKNKTYSFLVNQSLYYNYSNNSYYISNKDPCFRLKLLNSSSSNLGLPVNLSLNSTNSNNNSNNLNLINNSSNFANLTQNCNYQFKINPKLNLTTSKIEFNFIINTSNFTINYWIENYENLIVKNKINTTNKNTKTYTPKEFTNIYKIKAKFYKNNCILNDSKIVTYYSKTNSYLKSQNLVNNVNSQQNYNHNSQQNTQTNQNTQIPKNPNSYIKILNKNDIINNKINFIKYEIYKGDTLKRSIYFYHNKKKISSFQLKKYELKKGKFYFNKTNGLNELKIEGFELGEKIEFKSFNNTNNNIVNNNLKLKNYFNISNLKINNSEINFNLISNIKNISINCYILNKKTKVSKQINFTKPLENISIKINNSKLEKNLNYSLKILCKYKKIGLKSYKSKSILFNYEKISKKDNKMMNLSKISLGLPVNPNLEFTTYTNNSILQRFSYDNLLNSKQIDILKKEPENIQILDNSKNKENSIYIFLVGISTILSTLIFLW